jgi:hypothetical protein
MTTATPPPEDASAISAERTGKNLDDDLQLPAAQTTAEKHPPRQGKLALSAALPSEPGPVPGQLPKVVAVISTRRHRSDRQQQPRPPQPQYDPTPRLSTTLGAQHAQKSHHENNLLMQNVEISADCRCHNRTQLFNNVNHDPQDLVLITTKNTRSSLNCGVRRNHNIIQPLKYVNDHPQNLVFVKLQNTRSSSASVMPTWWRPRTDGRSHCVPRRIITTNHQQPLLEEGKPSVAPNRQKKNCRQCGCEDFQGGECASLAKNNYCNLAVYFY